MLDREKLQAAIEEAILPYAKETEDADGDPLNDPFVVETAAFLTQELIYSKADITEEQADLDDEDIESLPISHILTPHLLELLSPKDPISIISTIIQIYSAPEPDPEIHRHIRNGPCEVFYLPNLTDEQLCDRFMPLTFHHLIPRSTHRLLLKRHIFTRVEMCTRGASLCRSCHSAIHRMFDNKTLALKLNTIEQLLSQEKVQRFCEWKSKQRIGLV